MKTKEVKGITIISLVVTIVVLLILEGISVSTLLGENGVIKNAKEIQANTYYQVASEEVKQLVLEYKLSKNEETLEEFLESKVPSRIEDVKRKDDNTLVVKKNGYNIEVESENRIFVFDVVPYVGTYDGKAHDALKNVSVTPSDAKVEYSTDNGNTYVEEIPQITNASSIDVTIRISRSGYKTETVTKTAIINKAEGTITLSATNGTIVYPNSVTFSASGNTGTLSVSANNNNIATASVSGNVITVKSGTTAGSAIITVTSAETQNYTAKSATYEATIENGVISLSATPYTGTYDGQWHNAITSVTVNPSDATIEYSTDGTNYLATMPTILNSSSFTVTVRASKAGYKTQSTTQTVKVNKANGSLSLSSYSGTITYPNSTSFTASGTGSISAWSSNTGVATVSVSGNTIIVKSVGTGSATITVKSASNTNYNEKTATYSVTVNYQTFTGTSGVGYYADVDGNGTVDGIIFEDFKVGGSGSWGGIDGRYTIPTVSGCKDYYVIKQNYSDKFGTRDVLAPIGSGNERFYVMALQDYNNRGYLFDDAKKISDGEWKESSNNEWAAFASQFSITYSNYSRYGLRDEYWTSTGTSDNATYVSFRSATINAIYSSSSIKSIYYYVRLVRKF